MGFLSILDKIFFLPVGISVLVKANFCHPSEDVFGMLCDVANLKSLRGEEANVTTHFVMTA